MEFAAIISDTHESSPTCESRSLFPAYIDQFPQHERQQVYGKIQNVLSQCHSIAVGHLGRITYWHMMIHLGDLTGGWDERGLYHDTVYPLAQRCLVHYKTLAEFVGVCWGNHDTGYSEGDGGINIQSLEDCKRLSPLFWSKESEDLLIVGICSPLLEPYRGAHAKEIEAHRSEQEDFVADILRHNKGRQWVLCTHDPDMSGLAKQASSYVKTLQRLIFGDKHSRLGGMLENIRGYVSLPNFANLCRRRGILCPSIAPLWCRGANYLSAYVEYGRIEFHVADVFLPRDIEEEIKNIIFSSFPRSLAWMLRHKLKRMLS